MTSSGAPVACATTIGTASVQTEADATAAIGNVSANASSTGGQLMIPLAGRATANATFEQFFAATGGTGSGVLIGRYHFFLFGISDLGDGSAIGTVIQGNSSVSHSSSFADFFVQDVAVQSNFTFGVPFDVSISARALGASTVPFAIASGQASVQLLGFTDAQGNILNVAAVPEPGFFPILLLLAAPGMYIIRRRLQDERH